MARKVKGMVHLAGVTYRIVRVATGSYTVIRISDDRDVGGFSLAPALGLQSRGLAPEVLREVARLAIHTAKTSYVGFPRPDLAAIDAGMAAAKESAPAAAPAAASANTAPPAATSSAATNNGVRRPSGMPPAVPRPT
ncbi:MAG: hypothetical protein ABJB12_02810 [Pseudomonadota bacterium]